MPEEVKEYINKAELMKKTGMSRATIQRAMVKGMPFIRYYGNVVMYRWADVVEWLNENHYAPPAVIQAMREGRKPRKKLRKQRYYVD